MTSRHRQTISNDGIKEMINELKEQMIQEMKNMIDDVKRSIDFMSDKFDNMMEELTIVKEENKKIKIEVNMVKETNQELERKIAALEKSQEENQINIDKLEQYGRRANLEFHGIPYSRNEDTNCIIKKVVKKLNIQIGDNDISISHRLPIKQRYPNNTQKQEIKIPPIIVKFNSQEKRNEIYNKRKNILQVTDFDIENMKSLYINENLTSLRKSLLFETKKLKKVHGYEFVWTKMGEIYARKNLKSKVIKISSLNDLELMR